MTIPPDDFYRLYEQRTLMLPDAYLIIATRRVDDASVAVELHLMRAAVDAEPATRVLRIGRSGERFLEAERELVDLVRMAEEWGNAQRAVELQEMVADQHLAIWPAPPRFVESSLSLGDLYIGLDLGRQLRRVSERSLNRSLRDAIQRVRDVPRLEVFDPARD